MRLSEAKYQGDDQIVVILQDLPYSEVFDIPVEKAGPPLIDKRTGAVLLSYDLLDYSRYAEPNTMAYEEAKHIYPWQAEIAGTEKQIRQFLRTYFPEWSADVHGPLERSAMWDEDSVRRAAARAEKTGAIIENNASDQVSKILEAKYDMKLSAFKAFERYEELIKHKRVYGNIILEDHEYGEVNDQCYAQMWGWVTDVETEEQALKEAHFFASEVNVPYTGIDIDAYHPEPYQGQRVFATWIYVEDCPGVDQHYEDPLAEARYYKTPTAAEVFDQMDEVLDYSTNDEVDTNLVSVVDYGLGNVNHSIALAPDVAYVNLLVVANNESRAVMHAKKFLNDKNIPYQDELEVEPANSVEYYVTAQYVDPITEARYQHDNKNITDDDVRVVSDLYNKYETEVGETNPSIRVDIATVQQRLFTELTARWTFDEQIDDEEAEIRRLEKFLKSLNLPYTSIDTRTKWFAGEHLDDSQQVSFASMRFEESPLWHQQPHQLGEAKYYQADDKYECPDCEGEGGFFEYTLDGDIVNAEQCDMCQGKGYLTNQQAHNLIRWGDYKKEELKRLTEARYAEPSVMKRTGTFHFDNRKTNDWFEIPNTTIKFKVDHDTDPNEEFNARVISITGPDGQPIDAVQEAGVYNGIEARYQVDKFGWMVSGWIVGGGSRTPHSPWSVMEERSGNLTEAKYTDTDRMKIDGILMAGTSAEHHERVSLILKCQPTEETGGTIHKTRRCEIVEYEGGELADVLFEPNHKLIIFFYKDGRVEIKGNVPELSRINWGRRFTIVPK